MRQPASRFIVLLVALFAFAAAPSAAFADTRTDARAHYQAGVKLYGQADYRGAIKEFSAAQQLMPADLNNYNLALCYDKLGEAEPAIQYYREFLNKQPNADKRAEIEASIARLEAALKSASAKRAEEARIADEARKAEEAKRADEARKAEEARRAEEAKRAPTNDPYAVGGVGDGVTAGAGVGVGSTGTPGTGQAVSTGDAQLDRVQGIDVNQVRDQRMGGGASGMADTRGGPATNAPQPYGALANAGANPLAPNNGAPQDASPYDQTPPKKATPVYKKWWFWAVVAVSAYVVYSIASEGSNSSATRGRELPPMPGPEVGQPGGATLLRF
jgi:tetratricopeptide (TPR) repeat protein